MTAELAGADVDLLRLEIDGRCLILSGSRRPAAVQGDEVYQQVEIERGPFRRVVELAETIDADAAKAQYRDGILRVELPLDGRARAARAVPIESTEQP